MSKYKFKAFSTLTVNNAQSKLIQHCKKVGIYENFGQDVVSYLKDKYKYNPYSHESKDKSVCTKIESLDNWAVNFGGIKN